jgi:2-C-methyl-D-erythritol 4-phosphate cytidylyltransferase
MEKTNKLNVGILLCGGFGSRFSSDILKQMYIIDNLPIFAHSLKILLNTLDTVIIVVNSACFNDIKKITETLDSVRIHIIINDDGDRLESIYTAICFIKNNLTAHNIIIHDGARPFIKEEHITNLLSKMDDEILYTQYYFNLVNGLLKKNNNGYHEEVDRSEYIEICTPICANFELYEFLFSKYLKKENRICWELIPLLDKLNIKYELLEGNYKYMRKITTLKDVF